MGSNSSVSSTVSVWVRTWIKVGPIWLWTLRAKWMARGIAAPKAWRYTSVWPWANRFRTLCFWAGNWVRGVMNTSWCRWGQEAGNDKRGGRTTSCEINSEEDDNKVERGSPPSPMSLSLRLSMSLCSIDLTHHQDPSIHWVDADAGERAAEVSNALISDLK